jgi:hypothetical protein
LNPISKNLDFLAKILGRQIWNIGVYRRTKPKKAEKKTLAINLMKNRFTKIEHLV